MPLPWIWSHDFGPSGLQAQDMKNKYMVIRTLPCSPDIYFYYFILTNGYRVVFLRESGHSKFHITNFSYGFYFCPILSTKILAKYFSRVKSLLDKNWCRNSNRQICSCSIKDKRQTNTGIQNRKLSCGFAGWSRH